jgi:hypothetical protein
MQITALVFDWAAGLPDQRGGPQRLESLPQAYSKNQWVHRMEADIGLLRRREIGRNNSPGC